MKTFLAQNQFLSNPSVISPRTERSAVASIDPSGSDATAAPNSALASAMTADTDAAPDLTDPSDAASVLIADPDGGYMGHRLSPALGTSVGIAATDPCQEPVAAPPTDHIHEIFHYVRKLMKQPPRFVLDEAAFMAEVEEVPLFIREDGYLKRQA